MRKHGQNLQRKTSLDVREGDNRILKVIKHQHEQKSRGEGDYGTSDKNDDRVRQDRNLWNECRASHADDLIVLLCRNTRLVLLRQQAEVQFARNLLLLFQLLEASIRSDDLLFNRSRLRTQAFAGLLEFDQLVPVCCQVTVSGRKRATDSIDKFLLDGLQLLLLGPDIGMLFREAR